MSRTISFEPEAEAELAEALAWYRDRSKALPARLLAEVNAAAEAIAEAPGRFARIDGLPTQVVVRKVRFKRFPYALVFVATPETIHVIAFAHQRRRPLYWSGRLPR